MPNCIIVVCSHSDPPLLHPCHVCPLQEDELQTQTDMVEKLTMKLQDLEESLEASQQESNLLKKQVGVRSSLD